MRQTRDRLSAEIEGMSYDEMVRWFRGHRYKDPVLQGLAEKAAQQAAGMGSDSGRPLIGNPMDDRDRGSSP
jgi:hypothetical protein